MEKMQNACLMEYPSKEEIINRSQRQAIWGVAGSIDIYECCPQTIRDAEKIKEFVRQLCDLIEKRRFGETQVVHFFVQVSSLRCNFYISMAG